MNDLFRKARTGGILFLMLFMIGAAVWGTSKDVQAAQTGFRTVAGKTYYIDADGSYHKGWLNINGKKYYFNKSTGVQVKGWTKDSKGRKRYFSRSTGEMVTGWVKSSTGKKRYFTPRSGVMRTGWAKIDGARYYFNTSTGLNITGWQTDSSDATKRRYFDKDGKMVKGWHTASNGTVRYFQSAKTVARGDGLLCTGFKTISGSTYYFSTVRKDKGKMLTGWQTISGKKYYFDTSTGAMYTGTKTVEGESLIFDDDGVYQGKASNTTDNTNTTPGTSTGTKTIRNYLLGALQPVGQALYVWGGGWNDSTRKGVSPKWKAWYNQWISDPDSYDYNNYRDLSVTNRAKGLDCSGFVGWAAYQVMQSASDANSGYTVVSGDIGSYYKSLGWASNVNQSYLSSHDYKLKAGDVGYNDGHTFIVIGQCSDGSIVIVHSTPQAGCQLSGTSTPSGDSDSEAVALAKKYMSKYSGYSIFNYHPSCGNYIKRYNYARWKSTTLSDPDGFANMTAAQILYSLYGY